MGGFQLCIVFPNGDFIFTCFGNQVHKAFMHHEIVLSQTDQLWQVGYFICPDFLQGDLTVLVDLLLVKSSPPHYFALLIGFRLIIVPLCDTHGQD
jgi:hypothetical protein